MKKKDIVNLIKYHIDGDDNAFREQVYNLANEFSNTGDKELASYLINLVSDVSTIVPMSSEVKTIGFLEQVALSREPLYLPEAISNDLKGVIEAVNKGIGINKFLFYGAPGTGKTEAISSVARILKKDVWKVNISELIDSKLGATAKNIESLFSSINEYPYKKKMLVLFDEIDALALRRSDSRDLREMSRATTELFQGLDGLSKDVVLFATTNLYNEFDSALSRRFFAKINFSRYTPQDLIDIGVRLFDKQSSIIEGFNPNLRLVRKILSIPPTLPYPGELKNLAFTSIAFSDLKKEGGVYARLLLGVFENAPIQDIGWLSSKGFTTREIQAISGISKSEVSRRLKNEPKN